MLAGTLSACAAVDSTVAPRYDTVSRSIAQARNESILLNIVRASHDYPLSFSTVSQVIPQMTNTTTLGMPSFLVGPNPKCVPIATCLAVPSSPGRDVIFGNSNNFSDAVAVQTQFTLSTQETKDFYNALLRPVDLYILKFFIRQGYSRELLFWLFMDSVDVTVAKHTIGFQFNPPYDYGCPQEDSRKRCFREWTELATITGLSVDEHTEGAGGGGGGGGAPKGKGGGGGGGAGGGGGGGGGGKTVSRFCFDDVLAKRGQSAMEQASPGRPHELLAKYVDPGALQALSPKCGSPWPKQNPEEAAADTLRFHVGPLQFDILPRSAYGIYQFLGRLLRQSNGGAELVLPPNIRVDEVRPELSSVREDKKLLNVVLNQPNSGCFAETHFIDGYYCVPEDGSANTKRIFGLLAQLLALQTSASDLAITPTVHTVQ
jgi:uncharacterized membrane protein YgcG